jgi:hypothetical protein
MNRPAWASPVGPTGGARYAVSMPATVGDHVLSSYQSKRRSLEREASR